MWAALLASGALVALIISWRVKPARFWICLFMFGYFVPRYWDISGMGQIYMFNLLMDATICLIIERYAALSFEVGLYKLFKASALASLVFMSGHVMLDYFSAPSTFMGYYFEAYGIVLEAINWTALAIITREGWPEFYGRLTANIVGRPHRHTAREAVRAPRTTNSWQRR